MIESMIDKNGYRLNVGIILVNDQNKLLWARRYGTENAWQFPQGGLSQRETLQHAMYRELTEELGLQKSDVEVIAVTKKWLSYRLPKQFIRYDSQPLCIGQRQKWFLLRLISSEEKINLNISDDPEFDTWCWVDYWYPVNRVIEFKRTVYQKVLKKFAPVLGIKL